MGGGLVFQNRELLVDIDLDFRHFRHFRHLHSVSMVALLLISIIAFQTTACGFSRPLLEYLLKSLTKSSLTSARGDLKIRLLVYTSVTVV